MSYRPNSATFGLDQQWSQVQGMLRAEFGETTYRTWLGPLQLAGVEADRVLLTVPTRFLRDWIAAHYADRIRTLWHRLDPQIRGVRLIVETEIATTSSALPVPPPTPTPDTTLTEARPLENEIGAPVDPRCTFENFVVGPPNELAYAAAKRVAELEAPPFNPLFVYGGVGLGKTHLMHAIAWQIRRQNPGRKVVYLSAEKFMYQFIKALRFKDTMSFKELFRSADVLMVDDVQFIGGKGSTQEEFFHTFNTLVDRGRQIVVSADRSPSELIGLEERIRSRLGWGLVVDIHPTTFELRLDILRRKAMALAREVEVPDRVLEFLAQRITANVRELEGALNRVVAQATLVGRAITLEMTQEILQDSIPTHQKRAQRSTHAKTTRSSPARSVPENTEARHKITFSEDSGDDLIAEDTIEELLELIKREAERIKIVIDNDLDASTEGSARIDQLLDRAAQSQARVDRWLNDRT